MPICLDRHPSVLNLSARAKHVRGNSPIEFRESQPNCINIGLINNMPSAALEATERQFRAQLDAAAEGIMVRLRLYALPEVPRIELNQRYVCSFYSDVSDLWNSHLDGLIVTGTEPRATNLMDEPYWGSLTKLMDWAERHTYSTIWSCLAAHAAVLHIDGIVRRPLSDKRFGVFECSKVSDHPLMATVQSQLQMPHSRWNEIPEHALVTCGYRVLTRSKVAGVDAFVKHRKSLFVFFQGHPEYEADTLLREYRRDIGRFLREERDVYPSMPQGYLDEDTVDALTALRERALLDRREGLLADFPTSLVASKVRNTWRSAGVCIYRNWLLYLCEQKHRRLKARQDQREDKRVKTVALAAAQENGAQQTAETEEDAAREELGYRVGRGAQREFALPLDIRRSRNCDRPAAKLE
jgi:homoserine O-succinyltransferase/O-acetyltransferase